MKIILCVIAGIVVGIFGTMCWLAWYFRNTFR